MNLIRVAEATALKRGGMPNQPLLRIYHVFPGPPLLFALSVYPLLLLVFLLAAGAVDASMYVRCLST